MDLQIKFSTNNDLLKLEQTSAEDKIDNLEWSAGDTPVYKEEEKLQKNNADTRSINEGKLECSTCNKSFSEKHVLNRHIQSVHEKKKLFECSTCMKSFSRKDLLNPIWHETGHFHP